jgi:hypothetical protein
MRVSFDGRNEAFLLVTPAMLNDSSSNERGVVKNHFPWSAVLASGFLAVVLSCTNIESTSFDQSCEVPEDCVAVFSGDYCAAKCGDCDCANASIAQSALPDYEAARALLVCVPTPPWCPVCDCLVANATCVDSTCQLQD